MPDVLLIQPPIEDFYLTAKRTFPYGLAVVAAALRREGIDVGLLDALATDKARIIPWPEQMEYLRPHYGRFDRSPFALFHHFRHFGYSFEHLAQQARASGAAVIGISSLFSAYSQYALQTASAVKKACPRVIVVLGGHHPTTLPAEVMRHPQVDFVLRGDGEAGMPALVKFLRQGGANMEPAAVPGLVWRKPDGDLGINPCAAVQELDRQPVPAFDLIPWQYYQRSGRRSLSLSAGRGCPMRCSYCAVNAASGHGHRLRGVASILREIRAACEQQPVGFIDFEDEHLSADKVWFRSLLTGMAGVLAHGGAELRAMNGLYAPGLEGGDLALMKSAGFRTLNLALITTDPAQLKRFRRPDTRAGLERVLSLSGPLGLNAVAYLIVAGPEQDPYASVADLLYLASRRVLAGVSVFYPAPGSADYSWCAENNLLPSDFSLLRATALPLRHVTDRTQAVTLLRLGRVLNFMKRLLDEGLGLPQPAPAPRRLPAAMNRQEAGRILIGAFLHSGRLHGVDESGAVYEHCCDERLARAFLEGLKRVNLKGHS